MSSALEESKRRSLFDRFVLALGVIEPLSTLPQLYQVWIKGLTTGVSALTWFSYFLIECVWLGYGIKQKDKAIIYGSAVWGLTELLVAIGVLVK